MYANKNLKQEGVDLLEQVDESYQEFAGLIERNAHLEQSVVTIREHLSSGHNYERALFAISSLENEVRNEQRFMSRFPGKIGRQAGDALANLLECAQQLRLVI